MFLMRILKDFCPFSDWSTLVVGKVSPWLQLDSRHEVIRRNSEKVNIFISNGKISKIYLVSTLEHGKNSQGIEALEAYFYDEWTI